MFKCKKVGACLIEMINKIRSIDRIIYLVMVVFMTVYNNSGLQGILTSLVSKVLLLML